MTPAEAARKLAESHRLSASLYWYEDGYEDKSSTLEAIAAAFDDFAFLLEGEARQ